MRRASTARGGHRRPRRGPLADLRFAARTAYWQAVAADAALDAARAGGRSRRAAARRRPRPARGRHGGRRRRARRRGAARRGAPRGDPRPRPRPPIATRSCARCSRVSPATEIRAHRRWDHAAAARPGCRRSTGRRGPLHAAGACRPDGQRRRAGEPQRAWLPPRQALGVAGRAVGPGPAQTSASFRSRMPGTTSWSVGVVAGWTLFDGHRTGAEVAALDAEREALEADLGELERQIALEVETARLRPRGRPRRRLPAADASRRRRHRPRGVPPASATTRGSRRLQRCSTPRPSSPMPSWRRSRARSGAWIAAAGLRPGGGSMSATAAAAAPPDRWSPPAS